MRNPRGKRAASVPAVAQLGFQFAKLAPFGVVFAGGGAYEQRGASGDFSKAGNLPVIHSKVGIELAAIAYGVNRTTEPFHNQRGPGIDLSASDVENDRFRQHRRPRLKGRDRDGDSVRSRSLKRGDNRKAAVVTFVYVELRTVFGTLVRFDPNGYHTEYIRAPRAVAWRHVVTLRCSLANREQTECRRPQNDLARSHPGDAFPAYDGMGATAGENGWQHERCDDGGNDRVVFH